MKISHKFCQVLLVLSLINIGLTHPPIYAVEISWQVDGEELESNFSQAAQAVMTLSQRPSQDILLNLYGLYKQASLGDQEGKKPSLLNWEARAKYKAWKAQKGKSKQQAMREYIQLVNSLL